MSLNKRKISILIISIITLILTFGITFAVFNYNRQGEKQDLIVGDIWMKYDETNELFLSDAIPIENPFPSYKILKFYEHNKNMTEDELQICVSYIETQRLDNLLLEELSFESFCHGEETDEGTTFQQLLDDEWFSKKQIKYLEENNIVTIKEEIKYLDINFNTNITENEVNECVIFFRDELGYSKRDHETYEDFCRGTGDLNYDTLEEKIELDYFLNKELMELRKRNIVVFIEPKDYNLSYFEFEVTGKNTYDKKDIFYEVVLTYGDSDSTRTTRLEDEFLRFRLVEVDNNNIEKEIFNNRGYDSLENQRIWLETIPKNTNDTYNKKYRLYAWISNDVVVGNVGEDYTLEEWNNVFASIKVNVFGDLEEKSLVYEERYDVTDESCFETKIAKKYSINPSMTAEEFLSCLINYSWMDNYGTTAESFCNGTGKYEGKTFQEYLDLDNDGVLGFTYSSLESDNIIIGENNGVTITGYDKQCESDVVIPRKINGYDVLKIDEYAFKRKKITSVVIPNTITHIYDYAFEDNMLSNVIFEENTNLKYIDNNVFSNNQLTSIEIPNSVMEIRRSAFSDNYLSDISFEKDSKLEYIGDFAFSGEYHTVKEVTIPETVTDLSCVAFNEDVIIYKNDDLTCTEYNPK